MVRIDAGPDVFRLVEERLGIKKAPQRVQIQARRLGVTRARVYQLLEACGDVMSVRWPEGEELFLRLDHHLAALGGAKVQLEQLRSLVELIFPELDIAAPPQSTVAGKARNKAGRQVRAELGGNGQGQPSDDQRRRKSSGASLRLANARG